MSQNLKNKQKIREYQKMVEKYSPNSEMAMGLARAFLVGGLFCVLGEALTKAGEGWLGLDAEAAGVFRTIVLVFLGSTLTGLGVYDRIGQFAGAGSIVPITGFANSIVAPAMEFKREGYVMGVGAKLFSLAGPVLVYGVSSSIIVGLIYYFFGG